jgi:hypothetical protein
MAASAAAQPGNSRRRSSRLEWKLAMRPAAFITTFAILALQAASCGDSAEEQTLATKKTSKPGTSTNGGGGGVGDGGAGTGGSTAGSGGAGGQGTGLGGAPMAPDPCEGVSADGTCLSQSQVAYCASPTGDGEPKVVKVACAPYEDCKTVGKVAACYPLPGACYPGTELCASASTMKTCNPQGAFVSSPCAGCKDSAIGVTCQSGATQPRNGVLHYQARGPNASLTDWGGVFEAPAPGLLVISYRSLGNGNYVPIDTAITDQSGSFTVDVPVSPTEDDLVVFYAVRLAADGKSVSFAVAQPAVADGQQNIATAAGAVSNFWSWSAQSAYIDAGTPLVIAEQHFSGAMRLFDYLRYVYDSTSKLAGSPGLPLVLWIRPNTSWSCGACAWAVPATISGSNFGAQLFISALAEDTSYWSDAVTAHELGHWTMQSYGASPGEGGKHYVHCPSFPGMAWSEGWATAFSSIVRGDSRYYDKQSGTFFWFDIGALTYDDIAFSPPSAAAGLLQPMDENYVAAMIWGIAEHPADPNWMLSENKFLLDALSSARMTKSPYGRGYTRHMWDVNAKCTFSNVKNVGVSSPMIADFLDALVCAGLPTDAVGAVTGFGAGFTRIQPTVPSANDDEQFGDDQHVDRTRFARPRFIYHAREL